MRTNSTEDIQHYKEAKNARGSRTIFPGFISFTDCTEQQIQSRPEDKRRRKGTIL